MDSVYDQGALQAIDIDELGIRPSHWTDDNKDYDDSIKDYFASGKTIDITVYSAEVQSDNDIKKRFTTDDDSSMSDDDDSYDYDIDPETGEKNFRELPSATNKSPDTSHYTWIEQFLSNIETPSHQYSTNRTTTTDDSEHIFDHIDTSFFDKLEEQVDPNWFSNLLNSNENIAQTMFSDSNITVQSNDNTIESSAPSCFNENTLINPSGVLIDDEYSNYSVMTFDDTKSEKTLIDTDMMQHIVSRRTSIRSSSQRQQDEDSLRVHNIPLNLYDITESNTDDYNRHIARLNYLTGEQMNIIKDIRRRAKNKIAAQNCRKRKATSVETLAEQVDQLKRVKYELEERKKAILQQITETRHQYEYLHQRVLPNHQLPPVIIVQ